MDTRHRRHWCLIADQLGHEPWTDKQLATIVRLITHMHERWARDGLTAEQANTCVLSRGDLLRITAEERFSRGRAVLETLTDMLSITVTVTARINGSWPIRRQLVTNSSPTSDQLLTNSSPDRRQKVITIHWPKFAKFQKFPAPKPEISRTETVPPEPEPEPEPDKKHIHTPIADFKTFWAAYPRKVAKGDALKAWQTLRPDAPMLAAMLAAITWQKDTDDWTQQDGKFIPYPATWLRAHRWEDECTEIVEDWEKTRRVWYCTHNPNCPEEGCHIAPNKASVPTDKRCPALEVSHA